MLSLLAAIGDFVSGRIEPRMETLPEDLIDKLDLLETATAMSEFSASDQDLDDLKTAADMLLAHNLDFSDLETAKDLLTEGLFLDTGKSVFNLREEYKYVNIESIFVARFFGQFRPRIFLRKMSFYNS